jgi:hypothetical protein
MGGIRALTRAPLHSSAFCRKRAGNVLYRGQHLLTHAPAAVAGRDHQVVHIDQRAASKGGKAFEAVDQTHGFPAVEGQQRPVPKCRLGS